MNVFFFGTSNALHVSDAGMHGCCIGVFSSPSRADGVSCERREGPRSVIAKKGRRGNGSIHRRGVGGRATKNIPSISLTHDDADQKHAAAAPESLPDVVRGEVRGTERLSSGTFAFDDPPGLQQEAPGATREFRRRRLWVLGRGLLFCFHLSRIAGDEGETRMQSDLWAT